MTAEVIKKQVVHRGGGRRAIGFQGVLLSAVGPGETTLREAEQNFK